MTNDIKTRSIILSLLIIASFVVGYFLTLPSWNRLATSRAQLQRVQVDRQNLTSAQTELNNFLTKYESLITQSGIADRALPSQPQPAILLASIEEMANASGLALSSVNFSENLQISEEASTNSVVVYNLQINGSSSYSSFIDFLTRIESHLRIIDLQNISFKIDEALNLGVEMHLRTYYQKK